MVTQKLSFTAKIITVIIFSLLTMTACNIYETKECGDHNEFVYIGLDGNVYKYDICSKQKTQLTSDAKLNLSAATFSGEYYLDSEAWSPNREYIIVKFRSAGNSAFLINLRDNSKFSLGDFENFSWSPSGQYLALARTGFTNYESYMEDIYVFDIDTGRNIFHDPGRAPYWISDHSLAFLRAKQQEMSKIQELWKRDFENGGSGQSAPLSLKVESVSPPHDYTNRISFSPDRKWMAVFVPGVVETSELRIYNLENNQFLAEATLPLLDGELITRRLTTLSDFDWSPTKNILAFCKSGGGADDAYNALYGGALFLVNEGEIIPVTESKCGQTQISWRPQGEEVAYLNSSKGVSIVDANGNILFSSSNIEVVESSDSNSVAGPWWSPDGNLISIVANNKICLAHVEDKPTQLLFECVVDGTMMAWKP